MQCLINVPLVITFAVLLIVFNNYIKQTIYLYIISVYMFIYKITPAYIDFICDNLTFHTNSSRVPKYVQNSFPRRLLTFYYFIITIPSFRRVFSVDSICTYYHIPHQIQYLLCNISERAVIDQMFLCQYRYACNKQMKGLHDAFPGRVSQWYR